MYLRAGRRPPWSVPTPCPFTAGNTNVGHGPRRGRRVVGTGQKRAGAPDGRRPARALLAGSHNTAAPAWAMPDIGVSAGKRAGCRAGDAPEVGRRLLRVGTWEAQSVFSRVAIVNRGEAAMRLIHAVRDLSAETGTPDRDGRPLHRRRPRPRPSSGRPTWPTRWVRPRPARTSTSPCWSGRWCETGADAAWVGWGFVAEDPAFAELCEKVGVTFIGPSADAMRKLGDKIGAKLIAEEVGVPVAPWSRGAVATLDDALRAGDEIGYPLMLKATAGGGGRGIRMVASAERPDRRLRAHQPGGAARVRQRRRVPGAPGHRRPARRGPGDRRRPGHRVGAGRPRLLGAAAQPEDHRGVRLAGPGRRSRPPS